MKIIPEKNYRKPLYAIGIAAAVALTMTGCTDPDKPVQLDGDVATIETTDVELSGEVAIDDSDPTDCTTADPTDETKETDEVVLDGEVAIEDTEETK